MLTLVAGEGLLLFVGGERGLFPFLDFFRRKKSKKHYTMTKARKKGSIPSIEKDKPF